jgi:hypothetical protein
MKLAATISAVLVTLMLLGMTGCSSSDPEPTVPMIPTSFNNSLPDRLDKSLISGDAAGTTTPPHIKPERLELNYKDDLKYEFVKEAKSVPRVNRIANVEPGTDPQSNVTVEPLLEQMTLSESIQQLVQRHVQSKREQELLERYIYSLIASSKGQPEKALKKLQNRTGPGDDFVRNLIEVIVRRNAGENKEALGMLEQQLIQLRKQNELSIQSLALVKSVTRYKEYEKFPTYEFSKGQPIILYLEPKNFSCIEKKPGKYFVALDITITIVNSNGDDVESWELHLNHNTNGYISDLFVRTQNVTLPHLMAGNYEMRVTVRDNGKPDSEPAKESLPFKIKVS